MWYLLYGGIVTRWGYDKATDRWVGHDFPGVVGNGFVAWEFDELELGARATLALDNPERDQWWWVLIGNPMLEAEERRSETDDDDGDPGLLDVG